MHAIVTVGISASGKSSYAGLLPTYTEVNRDDIRFGIVMPQARGWKDYQFSKENEAEVTRIAKKLIDNARYDGENVIVSDTFLGKKNRRAMIRMLQGFGYEVDVVLFSIKQDEAILRDSFRGLRSVGEGIIKQQYQKWENVIPELDQEKQMYGIGVEIIDTNKRK